ncbi:cytoplasmic polyadenylation element-binding protein 2 isoform X2 [Syngnathoides biaculeatus]|uniref:cytoplasmic polyadenylation element-binding protein 2 isoform X2 n=1 Tax=Syngnathoides biaculeatus TaxID=300417 RepID=UPI002ADD7934|nr:cytoplasmic polyadenylation element-binding protein 2 isoform X2 [Syngnathoides biaculeatus]
MQDEPAGVTRRPTPPSAEEEPAAPAPTVPADHERRGFRSTRAARDLQLGQRHSAASSSPFEPAEEDADAATPAPLLPTSVNPLRGFSMDAPVARRVNCGNDGVLSGGLGAGFPEMPSVGGGGGSPSPSPSPSLPGFGTPWSVSVQTCSSPSPPGAPAPPAPCHPAADFYAGAPASSCVSAAFLQGFGGPFSPQIRRSPTGPQLPHLPPRQRSNCGRHQPATKPPSPWGAHRGNGWSSGGGPWGRDHRRGAGASSPLKKAFQGGVIGPPKFPRSAGASPGPKSWPDDNVFRADAAASLQDRSRMYESLNMHSLETSLIDIMRAEQDTLKGRIGCLNPAADGLLTLNGRSSLFPVDDNLLDGGPGIPGAPGVPGVLGPAGCFSHQNGERVERFSRKVFVGGLPPDIDEDEITSSFRRFGHLVVDWPHKAESKSYFPPKGYAFLLFQDETSVQALIEACMEEDGKLYLRVSSPTIKDKPVQIRPWNLSDSDFVMDGSQPLDPRKTIFVGGVPRPLRAVELATIMDRLYGGVCYAGIDTDPELKYPKGAGRVAFSNQQSYIAAISARFVQLQHGDIDKRVEVKPYVLDDQLCDECQGARCGGKFAPFFCANVTCLQYYCEFCWANIHSRAGREFHKPLVKEGADRPRQIHFRWN